MFWAQHNLGGTNKIWRGIAPECPPWLRACSTPLRVQHAKQERTTGSQKCSQQPTAQNVES